MFQKCGELHKGPHAVNRSNYVLSQGILFGNFCLSGELHMGPDI